MAGGLLFRALLIRTLRISHPVEFAALGHPSIKHLTSLLPRYRELQVQFWKYLWGEKVFQVDDRRVRAFAWAARISDVALVGSAAILFWFAAKNA